MNNKSKINLDTEILKEWLITNGNGGYASSTAIGCNTRKYHGLLIAPLDPPASRTLILSKLDENIQFSDRSYNLYTNMYKNNISEGYKYLTNFNNEYLPNFTFQVEDTVVEKTICMEYKKNTVCILYKIKNGKHKTILTLAPVMTYRSTHFINNHAEYEINQKIENNKISIILDNHKNFPINIKISEGKYIEHNKDIFRGMYYIEEEKRGFEAEENLIVPGRFEIEINENEEKEISFVCSLNEDIEEVEANNVIKNEIIRLKELLKKSKLCKKNDTKEREEYLQQYIISADNFIVYRNSTGLHTILAGYHWFLDWGRDTLISFEGIVLIPNRIDIAQEILLTLINNIKDGLIPNGFADDNNMPLYNSVDASLLLFEQINKYIKYTKDFDFVKSIYGNLKDIISRYIEGIDLDQNNIYLDSDYLIVSGTINTQNTWMDVKYDGYAITPRNGKAVEINALWYNALKIMEELSELFEGKKKSRYYEDLAKKCKENFNLKFYNARKRCLYDVLGDGKVRPNQLFALSLTYPILDINSNIAKNIISTVEKKLLTPYGLRTLAKGEPNYVNIYEGDSYRRDLSYHQGPVWPWLLGLYFDALKNIMKFTVDKELREKTYKKLIKLQKDTKEVFDRALYKDGILRSISEIYDTKEPFLGKGASAQAWSVGEIYRIILTDI